MKEPEMEHAARYRAEDLTARMLKAVTCIYIAVEKPVADDISDMLKQAADTIATLTREHERLTAERDAHANQCASAERELLAAYAEVERLTAALQEAKKYVRHKTSCATRWNELCSCGFNKVAILLLRGSERMEP